jgi:hypothetical protein
LALEARAKTFDFSKSMAQAPFQKNKNKIKNHL